MERHVASDSFVREMQLALHRLYEPAELCKSPLMQLLRVSSHGDPAANLRRLLLEAIVALKPAPNVPPQAAAWRTYHILSQRYTEQYSQNEVAAALSLSVRQLRRQQTAAVRALADYLWTRYNLQAQTGEARAVEKVPENELDPSEGTPSRQEEMEWLQRSMPSELTDVRELVQAVVSTAVPLLHEAGVRLEVAMPEGLPNLTVQQALVRQALLGALTMAVRHAPGGKVTITAERWQRDVRLSIHPEATRRMPQTLSDEDAEAFDMARQLLGLSGGTLLLEPGDGSQRPFAVRVSLPAAEQVIVLVVDDNSDTLELVERYLAGTRYRFVGAPDPRRALAMAQERRPDLIVLDVMLPGIDGWELLGRLREHPHTSGVPIIVCTILPQERLAMALGAAAFLRKPLSRQALLAALDRQVEESAKGCA